MSPYISAEIDIAGLYIPLGSTLHSALTKTGKSQITIRRLRSKLSESRPNSWSCKQIERRLQVEKFAHKLVSL